MHSVLRRFSTIFVASGRWLLLTVAVLFFNEYLIYYVVIRQCSWPEAPNEGSKLNSLILADPHLLGVWRGHWFDKLRREWQMGVAFETALKLHNPEVVFVLGDAVCLSKFTELSRYSSAHFAHARKVFVHAENGLRRIPNVSLILISKNYENPFCCDLFDEGMWSDKALFDRYAARFMQVFPSNGVPIFAVVGNHDTGFHYNLHPVRLKWFSETFGMDSVHLQVLKGLPFVLVNSMAMENDGCTLCNYAIYKLLNVNRTLQCVKERRRSKSCGVSNFTAYVQPILLQHFPLYRKSDALCQESDAAPYYQKHRKMRQSWECLSKASSSLLLDQLQPRAVFSGHTHHGCITMHDSSRIPEWSVSSFSWRNTNNPSVLLVTFTRRGVFVAKCLLPRESTVIALYVFTFLYSFLSMKRHILHWLGTMKTYATRIFLLIIRIVLRIR